MNVLERLDFVKLIFSFYVDPNSTLNTVLSVHITDIFHDVKLEGNRILVISLLSYLPEF